MHNQDSNHYHHYHRQRKGDQDGNQGAAQNSYKNSYRQKNSGGTLKHRRQWEESAYDPPTNEAHDGNYEDSGSIYRPSWQRNYYQPQAVASAKNSTSAKYHEEYSEMQKSIEPSTTCGRRTAEQNYEQFNQIRRKQTYEEQQQQHATYDQHLPISSASSRTMVQGGPQQKTGKSAQVIRGVTANGVSSAKSHFHQIQQLNAKNYQYSGCICGGDRDHYDQQVGEQYFNQHYQSKVGGIEKHESHQREGAAGSSRFESAGPLKTGRGYQHLQCSQEDPYHQKYQSNSHHQQQQQPYYAALQKSSGDHLPAESSSSSYPSDFSDHQNQRERALPSRGHYYRYSSAALSRDGEQVQVPVWQPLIKCEEAHQEMIAIQRELFSLAERGELLIESEDFVNYLISYSHEESLHELTENEIYELLDLAEEQGVIHRTKRNFAHLKTLCFVSLQLDVISSECLQWVLASLRRDEMSPTERAIQSRIKEAFALKITNELWDTLLESIRKQEMREESECDQNVKNSTTQSSVTTFKNQKRGIQQALKRPVANSTSPDLTSASPPFQFVVIDIMEDPAIGQMTKAIYPKDQPQWQGIDQNIEQIEPELYVELTEFLEGYFCSNAYDGSTSKFNGKEEDGEYQYSEKNDEKWSSSVESCQPSRGYPDERNGPRYQIFQSGAKGSNGTTHHHNQELLDFEEVRAIPGGRYGCAQFVKICGPKNLKECSLGRLAQLVQHAVKEDILRYHKTLLVWTASVDKHKRKKQQAKCIGEGHSTTGKESPLKNGTIDSKLNIVKTSLIEILTENRSGMSLAQLPLFLRRKLPFALDLNELGFPKLKDLILSMPERIKLELRGHNHPFAYLLRSSARTVIRSSNPIQSVSQQQQQPCEDVSPFKLQNPSATTANNQSTSKQSSEPQDSIKESKIQACQQELHLEDKKKKDLIAASQAKSGCDSQIYEEVKTALQQIKIEETTSKPQPAQEQASVSPPSGDVKNTPSHLENAMDSNKVLHTQPHAGGAGGLNDSRISQFPTVHPGLTSAPFSKPNSQLIFPQNLKQHYYQQSFSSQPPYQIANGYDTLHQHQYGNSYQNYHPMQQMPAHPQYYHHSQAHTQAAALHYQHPPPPYQQQPHPHPHPHQSYHHYMPNPQQMMQQHQNSQQSIFQISPSQKMSQTFINNLPQQQYRNHEEVNEFLGGVTYSFVADQNKQLSHMQTNTLLNQQSAFQRLVMQANLCIDENEKLGVFSQNSLHKKTFTHSLEENYYDDEEQQDSDHIKMIEKLVTDDEIAGLTVEKQGGSTSPNSEGDLGASSQQQKNTPVGGFSRKSMSSHVVDEAKANDFDKMSRSQTSTHPSSQWQQQSSYVQGLPPQPSQFQRFCGNVSGGGNLFIQRPSDVSGFFQEARSIGEGSEELPLSSHYYTSSLGGGQSKPFSYPNSNFSSTPNQMPQHAQYPNNQQFFNSQMWANYEQHNYSNYPRQQQQYQ